MEFITDDQTVHDLDLFGDDRQGPNVFSLFNRVASKGGELFLRKLVENPLSDRQILEDRITILQYLTRYPDFIEIDRERLKFIEIYLNIEENRDVFSVPDQILKELKYLLKPDNELSICHRAVRMLSKLILELKRWAGDDDTDAIPAVVLRYKKAVHDLIQQSGLLYVQEADQLKMLTCAKLDFYFRKKEKSKVRELLDIVYSLDAFKAVADTAVECGFVYPEFVDAESCIKIKGLFHPFLSAPVPNDFELGAGKNMCFLTGPNMAGKSTYMKSVGVAVYLAHIGFPVPAKGMKLTEFKGLTMTINLSDNIRLGYSHYYSEVIRVKQVAEQIGTLKNMVVIFDELFRGTNVKDAYEASLAVISAFAGLDKSMFLISTHILEVAEHLENRNKIDFRFFEIESKGGVYTPTYCLKSGVSAERVGMYILNREKVVETIRKAGEKN